MRTLDNSISNSLMCVFSLPFACVICPTEPLDPLSSAKAKLEKRRELSVITSQPATTAASASTTPANPVVSAGSSGGSMVPQSATSMLNTDRIRRHNELLQKSHEEESEPRVVTVEDRQVAAVFRQSHGMSQIEREIIEIAEADSLEKER